MGILSKKLPVWPTGTYSYNGFDIYITPDGTINLDLPNKEIGSLSQSIIDELIDDLRITKIYRPEHHENFGIHYKTNSGILDYKGLTIKCLSGVFETGQMTVCKNLNLNSEYFRVANDEFIKNYRNINIECEIMVVDEYIDILNINTINLLKSHNITINMNSLILDFDYYSDSGITYTLIEPFINYIDNKTFHTVLFRTYAAPDTFKTLVFSKNHDVVVQNTIKDLSNGWFVGKYKYENNPNSLIHQEIWAY